jgi:transmembrane sensor
MQASSSQQPVSHDSQAEAAGWLARQRGGDCTADEQQAFLRWLNKDDANRVAYQQAQNLWAELGGLESIAVRQLHEARSQLAHTRRQPTRRRMLYGLVASLVAIVVIFNTGLIGTVEEQTYRTGVGEHRELALADGSTLELDTDSEVVVRYTRQHRAVELKRGQALFTVIHGDNRPFDVYADNGVIHDIGTQFNVRRDADRVTVTVLDGEVEVSSPAIRISRSVRQGQQVSYTPQGDLTAAVAVDTTTAAPWRQNKLVFNEQPLAEVLTELRRYHAVTLIVNSPRINTIKVNGTFPANNLELALRTIATALKIKVIQLDQLTWQLE